MDSLKVLLEHGSCVRIWSGCDIVNNKMIWRADLGPDPGNLAYSVGPYDTFEALMGAFEVIGSRWRESGGNWRIFDNPNAMTI